MAAVGASPASSAEAMSALVAAAAAAAVAVAAAVGGGGVERMAAGIFATVPSGVGNNSSSSLLWRSVSCTFLTSALRHSWMLCASAAARSESRLTIFAPYTTDCSMSCRRRAARL